MENHEHMPQLVDLDKILAKQKSGILKHLPQFAINYLKRLIHQDEINAVLVEHGHLTGLPFIDISLKELNIKYQCSGLENLPNNGRCVFACNHPLGGLDGLILLQLLGKKYSEVKAIINELLLNVQNLKPLFTGVSVFGRSSRDQLQSIDNLYASQTPILVFPAGLVSRKVKGEVKDLKWKKSFLSKAIQHKRDIVPIYFEGQNSKRFYRTSNFRKGLNLKVNIEMLLLPDELFKQRNKIFNIYIGKPIAFQDFSHAYTHDQWADKLRNHVYNLGKENKAFL